MKMQSEKGGFLANFFAKYADLATIVLIAVFIALGVNIMAGSLISILPNGHLWIWVGLIVTVLGLVSLFIPAWQTIANRHEIYEGFLIHDMKKNKLIVVPRYRLSEKLDRYINAAFHENKELKSIWDREPMRHWMSIDDDDVPPSKGSMKLIHEAAEYFLLDSFSVHLSDYFNTMNIERDKLKVFVRDDLPQVVRQNRFLNLISKPPEERSAFNYTTSIPGVVGSYRRGALYHRFQIVLPEDGTITRINKNEIRIETQRFVVNLSVQFDGGLTTLPDRFELYYLDKTKYDHTRFGEYSIIFEIKIKVKWKMLLPGSGRQYYGWIDSFLDRLDSEVSQDKFFNSVGWSSALTVYDLLRSKINQSKN